MSDRIPTESHSEEKILEGCERLMYKVYYQMLGYLDFLGIKLDEIPEEERPDFSISYFQIVQNLFLYNTSHSGGTSTRTKCRELGVDSGDTVNFISEGYEPDWY